MPFKSFKPRNEEKWDDRSESLVPKKLYTYVVGFGFIPYDAKKEEEKYIKRRSNLLSLSLLIFLIVESSLLILKPLFFDMLFVNMSSVNESIYNIASITLSLLLSGVIYVSLIDMPFKKMLPIDGIDLGLVFSGIGIYLFTYVIGDFITQGIFSIINQLGVSIEREVVVLPKTIWESILHLILIYIIPVIIEETFFQGIILQSLKPIGDGFAIITTAILITLITANSSNILPVFLTSLVLSFFTIRAENILIPIIIRTFGSVVWGWQNLMVDVAPESVKMIIKSSLLITLLIIGIIAIRYIIMKREYLLELEDIESTINYKENISKFYTTLTFIIMAGLLVTKIFIGNIVF